MALVEVGQLGRGGIIGDVKSYDLPLHLFTDGLNIKFDSDGVRPVVDEVEVLQGTKGVAYQIESIPLQAEDVAWIYLTLENAYVVVNGVHLDITRAVGDGGSYNALPELGWTSTVLHGVPVFNNGFDVPQTYNPQLPNSPLVDLIAWPEGARVLSVRAFKVFLIGMSFNGGSGIYDRQTIIWSNTADPGQLPPDWNFLDPASRAGIYTFSETTDRIIDGITLQDRFIIYKENSVWAMRFVGGTLVFDIKKLFDDVGILNGDCAVAFGSKHFVVTKSDIVVHNGYEMQSPAEDKMRNRFFEELNPSRVSAVFCEHNEVEKTIWICYPKGGAQWCDRALIWDYVDDTWTFRSLPNVTAIARGPLVLEEDAPWDQYNSEWGDGADDPWLEVVISWSQWLQTWAGQGDPSPWDTDDSIWDDMVTWDTAAGTRIWDQDVFVPVTRHFVMASYVGQDSVTYDDITNVSTDGDLVWAGANPYPPFWMVPTVGDWKQGEVERVGLAIAGKDRAGAPTVDRTVQKLIREVWPEVSEGEVEIRIGTQVSPKSVVDWEDWQCYCVEEDLKLDFLVHGKFIAIGFRGTGEPDNNWLLSGYSLEVESAGRY